MRLSCVLATMLLLLLVAVGRAPAMGEADPLLGKVMLDRLEWRDGPGDPLLWRAEAWLGRDLHKLWLKSEGEYSRGDIEAGEAQVLYSRALDPNWDLQAGWRHDLRYDLRPAPVRDWLVLGLQGLAPWFFEVDAALFVGEGGRLAVRLELGHELRLSPRLLLTPELEVNLYGQDDEAAGTGAGLADLSMGLRLGYELRREFVPYLGVQWNRKYGDTAEFARDAGRDIDDLQFLLGVRAWF